MSAIDDEMGRLAEHVRFVMRTRVPEVTENNPRVTGAGMAWRDGVLKFVVQTDRMANVIALRDELPSTIEDFPTTVEVASMPLAASAEDMLDAMPRQRGGFWKRAFAGIFAR